MYKEELSALLADSVIINEKKILDHANTSTFATGTASKLIVRTRSLPDIISLLKFCSEKDIKLSVISCGKNWGFGSKVPVTNVEILLDLSLMNKIISYDEIFGTVRVEPGVTFTQLSEFLKSCGSKHFLNITGGDPGSSVLGNILERGDGTGPYCERSEFACSPEVVLADGEIINIGLGNIDNSKVAELSKISIGPNFQELFFQSNFGIVTKITIWLCQVPLNFRSFNFSLGENHSLSAVLEQLRILYQKKILTSPITFWNDYKQLVNAIQLPWSINATPPLSRSAVKNISNNYSAWYAFGGIYVDHKKIAKQTVAEIFRRLRKNIKRKTLLSDLSSSKIKYLSFLNTFLNHTKLNCDQVIQTWKNNPLLGHTAEGNTKSLFWRKQQSVPKTIDPALQLCGLHWNSFIMPFDGELISVVLSYIDAIIFKHGFEPVISFILLNDRYVKIFQQLIFDREKNGEDIKAQRCHQEVFDYLERSGYSHFRLDILSMNKKRTLMKSDNIHQKIKQALDPKGIISPGRYFID